MIKIFEEYNEIKKTEMLYIVFDKIHKFIAELDKEGVLGEDIYYYDNNTRNEKDLSVHSRKKRRRVLGVSTHSMDHFEYNEEYSIDVTVFNKEDRDSYIYEIIKKYIYEKLRPYFFEVTTFFVNRLHLMDDTDIKSLEEIEFNVEDIEEIYNANKFNL